MPPPLIVEKNKIDISALNRKGLDKIPQQNEADEGSSESSMEDLQIEYVQYGDDEREEMERAQELQLHNQKLNQLDQNYQASQQVDPNEYADLIHPWQVYFDDGWQKYYFYNDETKQSLWELPIDIHEKIEKFYEERRQNEIVLNQNNISQYISQQQLDKNMLAAQDTNPYMSRPARKQLEQSLATSFSYRQGDQEYNIWYDKFLTDGNPKDREQAMTRCDPELDSGYTKADLHERKTGYFCIHFARGCCCEGSNCRYFHRVPSLEECENVDQSKDCFGRTRHSKYRDDMGGIGSFQKECRSIYVSDFKMPSGVIDPKTLMYEILWRHFSVWGHIEDINLIQGKGMCFLRYKHRCMAEFAKEAMMNRALDQNEIITIRWANEDPNPKTTERQNIEDKEQIQDALLKKQRFSEESYQFVQRMEDQKIQQEKEQQMMVQQQQAKQNMIEQCCKMSEILQRIEQQNQEEY